MTIRPNYHFKDRRIEWWYSFQALFFGLFLLSPSASMDSPAFVKLISWMPEAWWGALFTFSAMLHVAALIVNGYGLHWTPIARAITVFFNTMIYAAFGFGFATIDISTTAVYIYGISMVSAGFICFWYACRDAFFAYESRHERAA